MEKWTNHLMKEYTELKSSMHGLVEAVIKETEILEKNLHQVRDLKIRNCCQMSNQCHYINW